MAHNPKPITAALDTHDAVIATRLAFPAAPAPDRIEVLNRKHDRIVYRIPGAGPNAESIIAKACVPPKSNLERFVYDTVLPVTKLRAPEIYAFLEVGPGDWSWLLLEDLGASSYVPTEPSHRISAARWLARFHVATVEIDDELLPDIGVATHRSHLRSLSRRLSASMSPVASEADARFHRATDRAIGLCARLEAGWGDLEDVCASAPTTLVHGDCLAKNVQILEGPNGVEAIPIDWASCGRGPAATCLGHLDLPNHPEVASRREHAAYRDEIRAVWPQLDEHDIGQLAAVGRMFWSVKAVGWALDSLAWKSGADAAADLEVYLHVLECAVAAADWSN